MKQLLVILFCLVSISSFAQYSNTKMEVGQKAPELKFKNPEGKELSLQKINKKRIILLDFWASWCGPCRMSNPAMVKMYNEYTKKKYKNAPKGFEIISISLDKDAKAWKAAIDADKLVWQWHMSDLGGWGSETAKIYGVNFVPQCFLIDANGVIVGKYMKAEDAINDLNKYIKE